MNSLKKIESGKNKGKYVYRLATPFLYYVKQKVTESPAIYFVVDIENRRIFWKYLSDEFLMGLNFEGKGTVTYGFSEEDILLNVNTFADNLVAIANKRNQMFLNKTPKEIAEMQDAVDYINQLMDHDLKVIKENVFSNLWRFGIMFSETSEFELSVNGKKAIKPANTRLFSLYPQVKGKKDFGVREFDGRDQSFFNHFDLSGKTSPMQYSQNTLKKIIDEFCKERIPLKCLPDIALFEYVQQFIERVEEITEIPHAGALYSVDTLLSVYYRLAAFMENLILNCDEDDQNEIDLRSDILRGLFQNRKNYHPIVSYEFKASYKKYLATNPKEKLFSTSLFDILVREDIRVFIILNELKERGIGYVPIVWNYSYFNDIYFGEDVNHKVEILKMVFQKLDEVLPVAYEEMYSRMFSTDKYACRHRYEYKFEITKCSTEGYSPCLLMKKYKAPYISFEYKEDYIHDITDEDKNNGIVSTISDLGIAEILRKKQIINDTLSMLFHEGLCKELGFNTRGIRSFL